MGFFSSRKAQEDSYITDDKSVIQVIRSRFYGKSKGKEREEISSLPQPKPAPSNVNSPTNFSRPISILSQSHSPHPLTNGIKNGPSIPRKSTDAITMTLAQRLNELATANSEGLLNDDEYRLLRQNLFERFASNTSVPMEASVVPLAGHALSMVDGRLSASRSTQRVSNNFHDISSRSPSIKSKTSVSSGMTTLLRRATGRKSTSASNDMSSNDTASIFSSSSRGSNVFRRTIFPRMVSKKSSNSSLQTETSRAPNDNLSISGSIPERMAHHEPHLHSFPRYQTLRRLGTPPSSFPAHIVGEPKHIMPGNPHSVFDDENLKTVKDIREEIWAVEAEGRRVMDAFNGLELSTMTRDHLRPLPSVLPIIQAMDEENGVDSTWTLIPEGRSYYRGPDSDTISVRSGTSIGTTPSMTRSGFSGRRVRMKPGTPLLSSRPTSLRRKNSVSSVSSQGHGAGAPPVPALPLYLGMLGIDGTSNVSLPRNNGHLTLSGFQDGDGTASSDVVGAAGLTNSNEGGNMAEMVGIRRRRAEVTGRYEARLEYLRAKLRGAELHDKLLRK